jgi:hypothetical protein
MVNARVQLCFVALLYAMLGAACVFYVVVVLTAASSSDSLAQQVHAHLASAVPFIATRAIVCLLLSGLSLWFLKLGWPWRVATIAGSLLLSLNFAGTAARHSADVAPIYLALDPPDHVHLAIDLGLYWGLTLTYSICPFLLWRQLRASNNRLERSRGASSVSQGGSR